MAVSSRGGCVEIVTSALAIKGPQPVLGHYKKLHAGVLIGQVAYLGIVKDTNS